jgi:hypothetical protein
MGVPVSAIHRTTKFAPMNPAPPVTRGWDGIFHDQFAKRIAGTVEANQTGRLGFVMIS